MPDELQALKRQLEAVTRERDNLRMVAQRTAAHCESLTNQLQEAKEEILFIGSKRTAAARAASPGKSSQSPSHTAIIQFDIDDPPKSLMSPDQAVQQKLTRETAMKDQALAELQVARDLAAKAMLLAEKAGSSPAPGAAASADTAVVKGWSQLCSTTMSKGANWLYTAKATEKSIDQILSDYYDPVSPTRGKRPERPNPRMILDGVAKVIDGRKKQLRNQEDELQTLISMIQKWDNQSRTLGSPVRGTP